MIGWLVIGTHKYFDLGVECLSSIRKNYTGAHQSKYFLFTDRTSELTEDWIEPIYVEHEKFPFISMRRYRHFANNYDALSECHYLYYVDADMKAVDLGDEILTKRMVTQHPGYWQSESSECSFDRNSNCNAYVPYGYGGPYFQNCFQGGESREFLEMSKLLADRIDDDLSKNIIPLWHDESHMNRYMADHKPTKIMNPGYAYCQHLEAQFNLKHFPIKILSLDKNHEEIRGD